MLAARHLDCRDRPAVGSARQGGCGPVALTDIDGTTASFPGFDRLSAPAKVIKLLSGPRLGTSKGNQVTLGTNAPSN